MRLAVLVLLAAACSGSSPSSPEDGRGGGAGEGAGGAVGGSGGGGGSGGELAPVGGAERPVRVYLPLRYDVARPAPLLVLLHGYGASGDLQEAYFHLAAEAERRGMIYVHPDGTTDPTGKRFWNASDACCDLFGAGVDDSAYLLRVIDDVEARYAVDAKRVFVVGHSNGAFMAYRLACDHPDRIAAIAGLAGAMPQDASGCRPSRPVSVLHMHGDADATILYGGGSLGSNAYPGARTSAQDWATLDGCTGDAAPAAAKVDLDEWIVGAETTVERWQGCPSPVGVELWTLAGGGHIPALGTNLARPVLDFLEAHARE